MDAIGDRAQIIYDAVKDLPIVDFHCHLSAKEIYEDAPFCDVEGLWLKGDHYKHRLMRTAGVDEEYITGGASVWDKFKSFYSTAAQSFGNPVRDWAQAELRRYFSIQGPMRAEDASAVFKRINETLAEGKLSPRSIMTDGNVKYVATTDDICDDLKYHRALNESGFGVRIAPTFRTDKLLSLRTVGYRGYLDRLAALAHTSIDDYDGLKRAVKVRLGAFVEAGCSFSDEGIEAFPSGRADETRAAEVFAAALAGAAVDDGDYDVWLSDMFVFLAREYKCADVTQQWHVGAMRNCNDAEFARVGADSGFDCVGVPPNGAEVARLLNAIGEENCPRTIIYTLNPAAYYPLISLSGAFRCLSVGVSWWFCDHRRGLNQYFEAMAELGAIGGVPGMVTDSRSFLSYVRHDTFRRELSTFLAGKCREEELAGACRVGEAVCYGNAARMVGLIK